MSVSQVKKRFSEFESFLKKDKEGLRRLKLLKDDVNVLRTSLAAAEEKAEQLEVIKNAARERADAAESERDTLKLEVHNLKQHAASLMFDLALVTKPKDETATGDLQVKGSYAEVKAVLKKVMKQIRQMPIHNRRILIDERYQSEFTKEDLISGWSYNSIWTLGAIVALWSYTWGSIVIRSSERAKDLSLPEDKNSDDNPLGRLIAKWSMNNINTEVTSESILYDLTTL